MIAGIISAYIVFKKEHVRFLLLPVGKIYRHFKESVPLFVSIVSIQVYLNLNKLIIGTFLGMSEVAIYDLGEKIVAIMKIPVQMVNQAVFPKISREKNIAFINKVMLLVTGIIAIGYVCVFICSKWIVLFLMGEYIAEAINVMRILGFAAIMVSVNVFSGSCKLIPFGYNKVFMTITVSNCIFFLCSIIVLWLFNIINLYTLSVVAVSAEVFVFLILIYKNHKLGLLRIIST
jgi:PST family polysaccharide transporter